MDPEFGIILLNINPGVSSARVSEFGMVSLAWALNYDT